MLTLLVGPSPVRLTDVPGAPSSQNVVNYLSTSMLLCAGMTRRDHDSVAGIAAVTAGGYPATAICADGSCPDQLVRSPGLVSTPG